MRSAVRTAGRGGAIGLLAAGVGWLLAACGGSGDAAARGPDASVTAEGAGVANTEPLWPLRVGLRRVGADGQTLVARASDRFGPAWLLEETSGGGTAFTSDFGFAQGRAEAFWSLRPEGVALQAASAQDAYASAFLVVPATVRKGMKWASRGADGKVAVRGEVRDVAEEETPFGRRRVWTLRWDFPQTGGTTTSAEQRFIEGRGPARARWSMVPTGTPEPPPRPARRGLSQAAAPFDLGGVTAFSVIEDPATRALEIQLGGPVLGVRKEINEEEPFTRRRSCLRTDGSRIDRILPQVGEEPPRFYAWGPCQDAAGIVFGPGGARYRIPMDVGEGNVVGDLAWWPMCTTGTGTCALPPSFGPPKPGLFVGKDGQPWALLADSNDVPWAAVLWGDGSAYNTANPTPSIFQEQSPGIQPGLGQFVLGRWLFSAGLGNLDKALAMGPETADGLDLVFRSSGWWGHAHVRERFSPHQFDGPGWWRASDLSLDLPDLHPVVVVLRSDNARELYEVSDDGVVWQLVREGPALVRRLLFAADLPDGHYAIGVVPLGDDRYQLWTQDGMTWTGVMVPPENENGERIGAAGWVDITGSRQYPWTVRAAPAPDPVPVWQTLDVTPTGRDVRLCVARGQTPPAAGWTLGGQAVRVLPVDERCVLLVRAHEPAAAELVPTAPSAWLLKGTLPALGEVEIGIDPAQDPGPVLADKDGSPEPLVAREGGGFASWRLATGPGAATLAWMSYDQGGDIQQFWTAEPGSGAAWHSLLVGGDHPLAVPGGSYSGAAVVRVPLDGPASFFPVPATAKLDPNGFATLHALEDGTPAAEIARQTNGLLASHRLDPAQGFVPLPEPRTLVAHRTTPQRAGGQRCAFHDIEQARSMGLVACEEPDGSVRRAPALPPRLAGVQAWTMLWSAGLGFAVHDDVLLRLDLDRSWLHGLPVPDPARFQPGTMTVGPAACAADGACFLVVSGEAVAPPGRPWSVLRTDRKGLGLHEVARGPAASADELGRLLADEQVLVLTDTRGRIRWRGFRDLEPVDCAGCTEAERCLRGLCDCAYGHVEADGTCTDALATGPHWPDCKAALDAGRKATDYVRLDPDGAGGPGRSFFARCDDPAGLTAEPQATFDRETGWYLEQVGESVRCTAREAYSQMAALDYQEPPLLSAAPWAGDPPHAVAWAMSSDTVLSGPFELSLAIPYATGPLFPNRLILDRLDRFDADGRYLGVDPACGSPGVPSPDAIVMTESTGVAGVSRDAAGYIRFAGLEADEVPWPANVPNRVPLRLAFVGPGSGPSGNTVVEVTRIAWPGETFGTCQPDCGERACGSDGCGGSCGTCPDQAACVAGTCTCGKGLVMAAGACGPAPGTTQDAPAPDCGSVIAAWQGDWTPLWVDADGAGPEQPYQVDCYPDGWTNVSGAFLGPEATRIPAAAQGTCVSWNDLPGSPAWPYGWGTHDEAGVDGQYLADGQRLAATNHLFPGAFEVEAEVWAGLGTDARLVFDAPSAFDPATLAWNGLGGACGTASPAAGRLVIRQQGEAFLATLGDGPDQPLDFIQNNGNLHFQVVRSVDGVVTVKRAQTGIGVTLQGTLAGPVRMVAEVGPGASAHILLIKPRWRLQ